jgi:hypothetical protein
MNQRRFRLSVLGSKRAKFWIVQDSLMPDDSGMAEAPTIQTLKDKRAEINGWIAAYLAQIA